MKKKLSKILMILVLFLMTLLVIEGGLRVFINTRTYEEKFSIKNKFSYYLTSWYGSYFDSTNCQIDLGLIHHPQLGYRSKRESGCAVPVTDAGTFGNRSLYGKKPEEEFSILVLGGSQASQLAQSENNSALELILNQSFSVDKKNYFRIYNGALPSWKMPNQIIMKLMYEDYFDAIIVLDGFNEFVVNLLKTTPWTQPPYIYYLSLPMTYNIPSLITSLRRTLTSQLINFPFLYNSYFFNVVESSLIDLEHRYYVGPEDAFKNFTTEEHYQTYLKQVEHLAKVPRGKLISHFLQPSSIYGKNLTKNEAEMCKELCSDYISKEYEKFDKEYRKRKFDTIHTHSLTKIFSNINSEIYYDSVHFLKETLEGQSGNKILAQAIAEQVGKDWKLKKKR